MFRTLLVDDEQLALISSLHSFPWQEYGFDAPETENDPRAALRRLETEFFDAAIVDIRMPEISGIDLIRQCREKRRPTSFAVLSGYSDFKYVQSALRLQAVDYCLKPVMPDEAVRTLTQLSAQAIEKRERIDPRKIEALDSAEALRRFCASCGMAFPSGPVRLALLRHPAMKERLLRLPRLRDEWFFLYAPDALLILSGQTGEEIAARFTPDEKTRCCVTEASAEGLQLSRQAARLFNETEGVPCGSPPVFLHAHESNEAFNALLRYVDGNYARQLSLQTLANQFHLNYTYCSELFRETTGTPFTKYLVSLRMRRAKELLEQGGLTLAQIAARVGYNNYHHFSASFKAYFNQRPTELQRGKKEG